MYSGGCSTRDISATISVLIGQKYSATWVSRITDVMQEKIEEFKNRKLYKWYPGHVEKTVDIMVVRSVA